MRILIIGGYGTFGARLAWLLRDDAGLDLIITGRNLEKAETLCRDLNGQGTTYHPRRLDRMGDLTAQIGNVTPDIIVDASGPFQNYGDAPYRVIEYALSVGAHYFDLADGTDFVMGVSAYDAAAKAKGVAIISGLSTYPALTSAVLAHWQAELQSVQTLRAGISPSPRSDMGRSVIDSILSYAGKPIAGDRHGLTQGFKARICPPGGEPIERLLFADVDVPDGQLLPDRFPDLKDVRNAAGTKPQILHRLLMGLSRLVEWRLLPSLKFLSPLIHASQKHLNFGAHRSGMVIEAAGTNSDGQVANVSWHVTAEGDDGPYIPAIPAAVLIRKALGGTLPPPGARAAIGEVSLSEYQTVFKSLRIRDGFRLENTKGSVYERILGSAYAELPAPIQILHRPGDGARYEGEADIVRGRNPLAALLCLVFRFPKPGKNIPMGVTFTVKDGIEHWTREFTGRKMRSTQEQGTRRYEHLMTERFGPFAIGIALVVKDNRLHNITQCWSVFGVPLPRILCPGGEVFEHAEDGRFNFHVDITAPLIGRIVKYTGWLKPA